MQTLSTLLVIGGWLLAGCVESKTYLPPEGFELRVPQEVLRLNEGEQRSILISVVRGEARIEDLEISVSGLPPGVTAEPATIPAGSDSTEVVLHAAGAVPHTKGTFTITARGNKLDVDAPVKLFIAGRSGTVDISYGVNGVMGLPVLTMRTTELKSGATIVIADASAPKLVKLTPQGEVDETFGDGGYLNPPFYGGMRQERVSSLFLVELADGKLLMITSLDDATTAARPDALSVSRLMPDGSLDRSYGNQGHAVELGAYRPYAAALGMDGDLLLWNNNGGTRLTRITSTGVIGNSSIVFDSSSVVTTPSEMVVQPDGKAVIPIYEPGLKPALLRFDTSLRLDPTFGQGGKLALSIGAFTMKRAFSGGYVAAFRTPDSTMPAVLRFDDVWRPVDGFESGGVVFPYSGQFLDSVSLDDATLGIALVNNAARIGRVLDRGMIDSSYGVDGMATITPLGSGDLSRAIDLASDFGLFVFVSRNVSQSTEVIRVWQ